MSNSTLYCKIHKQRLILLFFGIFTLACGEITPSQTRTPLPALTPTPVFYRQSSRQIVRAIQAAQLECEAVTPVVPDNIKVENIKIAQGFSFSLPSVCANCGGLVLSFNDPTSLETVKNYFAGAGTTNPPQAPSWVFVKDNILLQLDGQLSEDQAFAYGAVLVSFK